MQPESGVSTTGFPGNGSPRPVVPAPRSASSLNVSRPIRVELISGNRLLVAALTLALSRTEPLQVVATHDRIETAMVDPGHVDQGPDVLVVDLGHGQPERATEVRVLREARPLVPVVMTSVPADLSVVVALIDAGARGLLTADAELQELVSAICTVAQGQAACSPPIVTLMVEAVAGGLPSVRATHPSLTPRERQVARLLEQGLSNKEIARRLDIKVATVKNHVHNILSKLELSNRARVRGPTGSGSR